MDRERVRLNQVDGQVTDEDRRRAVRRVASAATDAQDCEMLLEALGLRAEEGLHDDPAHHGNPSHPKAS